MNIRLVHIKVRDLFNGYKDNGDNGVVAYGGKLARISRHADNIISVTITLSVEKRGGHGEGGCCGACGG